MERPPDFSTFTQVYGSIAEEYDASFESAGYRNIYDAIAWEHVSRLVPAGCATIIDAGCGTGRWAAKWLGAGHRVIGIEAAPGMIEVLKKKKLGGRFELLQGRMQDAAIETACADLVAAMGSVQYSEDPGVMIKKFSEWTRPGGFVCVYVDSFVALILELLRSHKLMEVSERLRDGWGIWKPQGHEAHMHLLDRRALETLFSQAGLVDIRSYGLLVTASAWRREAIAQAIAEDQAGLLELERGLSMVPMLADVGKHLLVTGRRP
jgi:SAM-dependent methyltransferase